MYATSKRVREYEEKWRGQGYRFGLPDSVPSELAGHAPSYEAIALALLRNDLQLTSLGYTPKYTPWYSVCKQIELAKRERREV